MTSSVKPTVECVRDDGRGNVVMITHDGEKFMVERADIDFVIGRMEEIKTRYLSMDGSQPWPEEELTPVETPKGKELK